VRENRGEQLRNHTVEELELKCKQMREELFNLRFRNSVQQLDNPLRLREVRRDIARLVTVLAEHRQGIRKVASGPRD
jgi:large subunit ribosomal protein L29